MICLYDSRETDFTHNGLGSLMDSAKAKVYEELNGSFTLTMDYPLYSELSNNLVRGNIIKCPVKHREPQLFRISMVNKSFSGIQAFAKAIAITDLGSNFIQDTNLIGKTRTEALGQILSKTMQTHMFTGTGTSTSTQKNLRLVRCSPLEAIIGSDDNCLLKRYGGEARFNNFKIEVNDRIGSDNGVLIAYGKNITGIEEDIDDSELATCIIPQGSESLFLPEYCINSPYVGNYEKIFFKHVTFDNIGVVEASEGESGTTLNQALTNLRTAVRLMYDEQHVDVPSCNYRVNFIDLSKTEEYKDYAILEEVGLGDTVTIRHTKMNIDLSARVINYTYDALLDKYDEIELGFKKKDIVSIIQETQMQIQMTKEKIELSVSNLEQTLTSKITMTESEILSEVSDLRTSANSSIRQLSNEISFKVDEYGVISAINMSPETIKINASKINISGFVTFSDLSGSGTTTINANNLKTGTINAVNISGVTISGSEFTGGNIKTQNLSAAGSVWFYQNVVVDQDLNADYLGSYGDIAAQGSLRVTGSKNCIQVTKAYGDRALYAYETADSYFGDIGYGQIVNGECRVEIDPVMQEIFNTDNYYHIFLTKYGKGDIWVKECNKDYFIIEAENDIRFSYEIKAKRRGYENVRLEEVFDMKPRNFGGDL